MEIVIQKKIEHNNKILIDIENQIEYENYDTIETELLSKKYISKFLII